MLTNPFTGEQVAKAATFLAYQASAVVGFGRASRDDITEDKLWKSLKPTVEASGIRRLYIDYGYGRMMKYIISWTDIAIEGRLGQLNAHLESWHNTYNTYEELFTAAMADLAVRK